MKRIGNILIAASALFFLETAFEMYALTLIWGPQAIGFALAHVAPGLMVLVFLSGLFYLALAVFAFVIVVTKLLGKSLVDNGYVKLMSVVLAVQIVHTILLLTYEHWTLMVFGQSR